MTVANTSVKDRYEDPRARDRIAALENLRTKLLDLTLSNRLLNFKQDGARVVRVIDELPDQLFERLRDGAELELLPVPLPPRGHALWERASGTAKAARLASAPTYAQELGLSVSYDLPEGTGKSLPKHADDAIQTLLFPADLEKALGSIASDSRSALEEKGSNILYLSFGFLEWYEADSSDKAIRSPLVMLPVALRRGEPDRKTGAYRFFVSFSNEDVLPNISLQEKLRRDFRLSLPDLDDEDTPESYFARIRENVPLLPRWKLLRQISLGLLSFSKLLMYRDLDPKAWPEGAGPAAHPRVMELLGGAESDDAPLASEYDFEDGDAGPKPPLVPSVVIDADSSQHSAIVDALMGKSLVIEGPPGTGKSQTIANLIASALDAGKTVLFVAEKLTALDVVRRRLDDAGLGIFCLELHSDKTQKSRMIEDLRRRIDAYSTFREPAKLQGRHQVVGGLRSRLNSYARRMNQRVGAMGWTVHDVLWGVQRRRSTLGPAASAWERVSLPRAEALTLAQYEELRRCASVYGKSLEQIRKHGALPSHPFWGVWAQRADPAFESALVDALDALRRAAIAALGDVAAVSTELGAACSASPTALAALDARIHVLHEASKGAALSGVNALATPTARAEFQGWLAAFDAQNAACRRFEQSFPDPVVRQELAKLQPEAFARLNPALPLAVLVHMPTLAREAFAELHAVGALVHAVREVLNIPLEPTFGCARMAMDLVECAARAPLEILGYRTASQDGVESVLETGARRMAELQQERVELDARFDLALLPDPATLEAHAAECASTGFFSFFSGTYRAAKRQYAVLARQPEKRTDPEMTAGFRALASHMKKRAAFESDGPLRNVLGNNFQGLDTRFDRIMAARAWQSEAAALQRRHRRFLAGFELAASDAAILRDLAALRGPQHNDANFAARTRQVLAARTDTTDVDGAPLSSIEARLAETAQESEPLRAISARLGGSGPSTIGELFQTAESLRALEAQRERVQNVEVARAALGGALSLSTATAVGRATLRYAEALFGADTPAVLHRRFAARTSLHDDPLPALLARARQSVDAATAAEAAFRSVGQVAAVHWYGGEQQAASLETIRARTERALSQRHALPEWVAFLRARAALWAAGGDVVRQVAEADERVDVATITEGAEFVVYGTLAASIFASDPELAHHDGGGHSELRQQFQQYDAELLELERERIAARVDATPVPRGTRAPKVKDLTELVLLEHEVRKQRAHIPIRQLVNRAGGALRALKPCFLMSPRSVAQYLEAGRHTFDLVVMDEASQLRPEDAIGAVIRGKQVVVVGDSKQLPPTSFFSGDVTDDGDTGGETEEAIADSKESILDLARTVFRSVRRLRWHYRSRHASLIAFSNHRYYDGNLIVFPSAHEASDRLGVAHVYIEDATYADGKNLKEANAVVDAVLQHLREHPDRSLGIVALNIRQKELIQTTLDDRLKNEPELRGRFERGGASDACFVKNLESVQGDERDVIFISVTYGPAAPGGPIARRFGPINAENGWRRLNVLFTRAKQRVVVFSSFHPEQLKEDGLSAGAKDLRAYLAFARTGVYQESRETEREPDSDFEVEVASVLRDAGYSVTPQVGVAGYFIDLAVRSHHGDGRYLLGVECDGAAYHSSFSARDRDRLRQQVLEDLGWRIHRIWSTDWYRDARTQRARLIDAVRASEGMKGR